jgi:hypothetical protein
VLDSARSRASVGRTDQPPECSQTDAGSLSGDPEGETGCALSDP